MKNYEILLLVKKKLLLVNGNENGTTNWLKSAAMKKDKIYVKKD